MRLLSHALASLFHISDVLLSIFMVSKRATSNLRLSLSLSISLPIEFFSLPTWLLSRLPLVRVSLSLSSLPFPFLSSLLLSRSPMLDCPCLPVFPSPFFVSHSHTHTFARSVDPTDCHSLHSFPISLLHVFFFPLSLTPIQRDIRGGTCNRSGERRTERAVGVKQGKGASSLGERNEEDYPTWTTAEVSPFLFQWLTRPRRTSCERK